MIGYGAIQHRNTKVDMETLCYKMIYESMNCTWMIVFPVLTIVSVESIQNIVNPPLVLTVQDLSTLSTIKLESSDPSTISQ
jgi:hypothetical protein